MEYEFDTGEMMIRSLAPALGLGLLLSALLAAAPATAGPRTLILYDGVASQAEATAAAAALAERLKLGGSDGYRVEFLTDAVFGGAEHWPRGGDVEYCPSGTYDQDLDQVLAESVAMAAEGRFGDVEATIGGGLANLACLAPPLDPAAMAHAALLLGWARIEQGDREGAKDAFSMATQFDPAVEWHEGYPSHAQQVFVFAARSALKSHDAHFESGTAKDDADQIRIDGKRLAERKRLRPGWHQVSVPTSDGGQLRLAVRFIAGGTITLVDSGELLESFLIGDDDHEAAGRAIAAVMARSGDDTAYLIEPSLNRVYRFDRAPRELTELPVWDKAPWRPQAGH